MKLSSPQKIVLGIFTVIPFILIPYIVYEIFQFVLHTIEMNEYSEVSASSVFTGILSFIFPIIFLSFLSLALMVFYIVHVAQNKSIDTTEKIIWILLFVFVGFITFPIYFIIRIEKQ